MTDQLLSVQHEVMSKSKLVFDEACISTAIDEIAETLNSRLQNECPLVLCVMNGGLIFTGQLITRLKFDLELDYLHVTRYQNGTVGNKLDWLVHPKSSLSGRTVLILDDILDEGVTLEAIIRYCKAQGASEVISAVLLQKKHDRGVAGVSSDYVALEVEDEYVFGFGMDYHGHLRHLPAIYAVKA